MKAYLRGRDLDEIRPLVKEAGIDVVESDAEFCICYGGDGALLGAEREFPGLPKVPIRQRRNSEEVRESARELLGRVVRGEAGVTRLPKLEARARGKCLLAMNDIYMRNASVTSAVRYVVEVDGVAHFGEVVGDGLVAATPFGSSAYYRAITNSVIHVGIGLAFNNSTEPVNHLVICDDSEISVTVTRGPALLAADNNPEVLTLEEGDRLHIRRAPQEATIWGIGNILRMDRELPSGSRRLRWLKPATERNKPRNGRPGEEPAAS